MRYQYSPDGEAMLYDLQAEPDAVRNERLWVEEQLRAARRENLRIGVFERLEVTIARVQEKHRIERIEAEDARLKRNREQMWSKHLR